jgi:diguanylate cyclase (GGDEF)-like protein
MGTRVNILLADDDPVFRLIAQTALRELGHACEIATDGTHAWSIFKARRPDVVISDWSMPGLSGIQLVRNIRAHPGDAYTYIIMVTGHSATEQILEGMSAGADDYLIKPLDLDDLHTRLICASRVTALHAELSMVRVDLRQMNGELTTLAGKDALTGLGNRRALAEEMASLEARATRYGHRYCIALLDVDLFKPFNDLYGHQAGDRALQAVADQLATEVRTGDAVFRYGGEEFLCVFPEQSLANGVSAVSRMRLRIKALAIPHAANPSGVLTISGGVAMMDPGHITSPDAVLAAADEALYRAKDSGRDRVERARSLEDVVDPIAVIRRSTGRVVDVVPPLV